MDNINYEEAYNNLLEENTLLKNELNEKSSIIQILYTEMDDINYQLNHYKELFSAANTNLLTNDKEVYELTERKNELVRENKELKNRLKYQTDEINELEAKNKSNETFINSYYNINNKSITNTTVIDQSENIHSEIQPGTELENRYELIPIDKITDWIIDYINSGCTFTLMNKHSLDIQIMKKDTNNKEKMVTYKKEFKNNKWTLRVLLKLFFMYYFPSQLNRLYANNKQDENTCTICYNRAIEPCILTCKCKHIYCYKCINKWVIKEKGGCPCCRKKGTIFEAGPITPMNYRMMIDNKYSISSIPQHLRIFA